MIRLEVLCRKYWKFGLLALLAIAVIMIYPLIARSIRVSGYKKLLTSSGGGPDPVLFVKLEEFTGKKDWSEARLLGDSLCPVLKEEVEVLLHCGNVYLEAGDVGRAREFVRRAKGIFRKIPGERVRIETKNPALFWKIGYLLREPGA